jgi:predicted AAA+ superfamily ATPase
MQFLPKFAGILSAEIEQDRRPGRFLVAAQRSKKFRKEFGKFGEGVVKTVEITPLRVGEVSGREALEKLWLRGGFPESYFAESEAASIEWRRRYPEAVMAGNAKFHTQGLTAEMLRKLLEVFVAYHGTITKHKSIQDAVGLCLNTVKSYMQLMEDSGMIRSLPSNSLGSDSAHFKYPKHYVRDTGLFHELLEIQNFEQLRNHKLFKLSWETFAIENIISSMPGWAPSYYLTRNRTGVELVLERGERRKLFTFRTDEGPEPTPSFERFSREFTNEPATIITPPNDRYPEAYPICRAIRVMTLPAFCKEALENKDGSSS